MDAAAAEKLNRNLFALVQAANKLNDTLTRMADVMEKENEDGQ